MTTDSRISLSPPPRFWPIILVILYIFWLFPTPEFNAYNKDDASLFHILASNWIVKGCYSVDVCPGVDFGRHGTWPPVFPAILGVVIRFTGGSWIAIKLLMVTMGLANVLLLTRLLPSRALSEWTALLTAITPIYFLFSHTTMTEVPFMLACTVTLAAAQHATTHRAILGAGTLAAVAFLTRGYAVTFVPAAFVFYCLSPHKSIRERFSQAVCFITPLLIAMLVWIVYTRYVQSTEHTDWLTAHFGNGANILTKAIHSPWLYLQRIYWWHLRFPSHLCLGVISLEEALSNPLFLLPSGGMLMLVAIGWCRKVWRESTLLEWWFVFGILLLLSTRKTSARYWITYLPFMFYYSTCALTWIGEFWGGNPRTATACLWLLLGLNGIGLAQHLANPDDLRFLNPYWRDLRDASLWLKTHTPDDSVVLVVKGHYQCHVASARCTHELAALLGGNEGRAPDVKPQYLLAPRADLAEPPFPEYVQLTQQHVAFLKNTVHYVLWESPTTILYEFASPRVGDHSKVDDKSALPWNHDNGQSIDK